jgi:hypothetical protein
MRPPPSGVRCASTPDGGGRGGIAGRAVPSHSVGGVVPRDGGGGLADPAELLVHVELLGVHGMLDADLQRRQPSIHDVDRAEEQRDQPGVGVLLAFANQVEQLFDLMAELGERVESERAAVPLQRVCGAEDLVEQRIVVGPLLELEQSSFERGEALLRLHHVDLKQLLEIELHRPIAQRRRTHAVASEVRKRSFRPRSPPVS